MNQRLIKLQFWFSQHRKNTKMTIYGHINFYPNFKGAVRTGSAVLCFTWNSELKRTRRLHHIDDNLLFQMSNQRRRWKWGQTLPRPLECCVSRERSRQRTVPVWQVVLYSRTNSPPCLWSQATHVKWPIPTLANQTQQNASQQLVSIKHHCAPRRILCQKVVPRGIWNIQSGGSWCLCALKWRL